MSAPDLAGLVRHLAGHPAFVGIGVARASRLAEAFGADLPRLLAADDPEPFVPHVGRAAAEALSRAWLEDLARGDVVVWLAEAGVDVRLAGRIVRLWGAEGARRVRERPYALMALADWREVDRAARRLGVPEDDPDRLVAAVEAVLYARLRERHTWTGDAAVRRGAAALLRAAPGVADRALALAGSTGTAVRSGGGWQPAGAAMMERYVAARLRAMVDAPTGGDLFAREVGEGELARWLAGARAASGVDLDEGQREAVALAVRGTVGMVLGGAGVGKTTVLRAACAANEAFGRAVRLTALAGRAARRASEATGHPASTLAAFLRAREAGTDRLGSGDLVVVDEASMVELPTFYRLLRALPEGARLLLVGDEAQLGPIGFGLALHALVDAPAVPRVRLSRVYRQADASGIPAVAASVRAGTLPPLPSAAAEGVALVALDRSPTGEDVVDIVAALGGFDGDLRVIAPMKGGGAGTLAMNARFHAIMSPNRIRLRDRAFAVGEPVMFGRNDYRRDLRNGSLGTVTDIDGDVLAADFDGVRHEFAGLALDDLSLAYAVTVHKAQGSQFHTVVVPVVPTRLLDRSLVYTALTRATHRAVFVGRRDVLDRAVSSAPSADSREVGLRRL